MARSSAGGYASVAKNCLVQNSLFTTKRSGKINLRSRISLDKELGVSAKDITKNYGRYAGCVSVQALHQEQQRGNLEEPVLLIGGRPSTNPYSAKPTQRIRYLDKNIADMKLVAGLVLQRLIEMSPIGPPKTAKMPHYYQCHLILVNGREFRVGEEIRPTDTLQFVNTIIYAKRIEQGWSIQAPAGVYRPVSRWASRFFGDSFKVRWGYRSLANVPVNKVRRYNIPRNVAYRTNAHYAGTPGVKGRHGQKTTFVTDHAAAASTYGFKVVDAVFPMIELKPKELAITMAKMK